MDQPREIVLASTSPYRRQLLGRLGLEFVTAAPGIAESVRAGESPVEVALRLALEKAQAVAPSYPDALVIGSDQVASCGELRIGKPGDYANARRQLERLSGRTARFDTAVVLFDARTAIARSRVVACEVTFRTLGAKQIDTYLSREQPYDCAGSAKSEGLGIALIARMHTDDPTSLIGLPLIALTELLADAGMPVLG